MERDEIQNLRRNYSQSELVLSDDPIQSFINWLRDAANTPAIVEANAMVLSTNGDELTSRSVLLKDVTDNGFTFFTNYNSRKAHAIDLNNQVSLLFPWYPMERQVIVLGHAQKVSRQESEKYFATRPWASQIGAWASQQSSPLDSREDLENRFNGAAQKWPEGSTVPTPPNWGGYLVVPYSIEFWQGRRSRLHDRIRFERSAKLSGASNNSWQQIRLYP